MSTLLLDLLLAPLVAVAALLLKSVRHQGLQRLRICRAVLMRIGLLPVRRYYYEPFFDQKGLLHPLDAERPLPGIDWNLTGQLSLLQDLTYADELRELATRPRTQTTPNIHNSQFGPGDAEFLYQIIRARKPRLIVEIGSGNSTLIAREALLRNHAEGATQTMARHICIEPYEAPWLEAAGVTTLRQPVETVDKAVFRELDAGDLLFIDSSHIIRPQGDVLTEYLEILPSLKVGVVVQIHDIFTPRDYPKAWLLEMMRLWNEQYLLEAFLTNNRSWKIIGALNLLAHHDYEALQKVCPFLTPDREPGSFYIQKVAW